VQRGRNREIRLTGRSALPRCEAPTIPAPQSREADVYFRPYTSSVPDEQVPFSRRAEREPRWRCGGACLEHEGESGW
jgi:hypothetical protein